MIKNKVIIKHCKTIIIQLIMYICNNIMKEIFKNIPDYNGSFQVSNFGTVKSSKFGCSKILNKYNSKGYDYVKLNFRYKLKRVYIHKIVAEVFLKNNNNQMIFHIDGNKQNNKASNLILQNKASNSLSVINSSNNNKRKSYQNFLSIHNNI